MTTNHQHRWCTLELIFVLRLIIIINLSLYKTLNSLVIYSKLSLIKLMKMFLTLFHSKLSSLTLSFTFFLLILLKKFSNFHIITFLILFLSESHLSYNNDKIMKLNLKSNKLLKIKITKEKSTIKSLLFCYFNYLLSTNTKSATR